MSTRHGVGSADQFKRREVLVLHPSRISSTSTRPPEQREHSQLSRPRSIDLDLVGTERATGRSQPSPSVKRSCGSRSVEDVFQCDGVVAVCFGDGGVGQLAVVGVEAQGEGVVVA